MNISRLLIANRGEIACRIIRTCRKLGIHTVAVYSDADARAVHVRLADTAIHIGPSESAQSYLKADAIIAAAQQSGAQAIHPGYGFLSENAAFAAQVEQAGILFLGPQPEVIRTLGDKLGAKRLAAVSGVPLLPSIEVLLGTDVLPDTPALHQFIQKTGFPLIIKAAGGGGGRGMRKVFKEAELEQALQGASREAFTFFGDRRIFCERFVERARHIEVQILGDSFGNVIHLYDRDCSLQRFHQKVLEEAPAPNLSIELRGRIHAAAIALCAAVKYRGAGTVEFLLEESGAFYLMEVNSRLQVEHPATEAITGLDLVELQIRIAEGRNLSTQPVLLPTLTSAGTAIELRVCAENPEMGFSPSTGLIEGWNLFELADSSAHSNIRIDSGFEQGSQITHYYDSLLAKIIVHAPTRSAAIASALSTLSKSMIAGLRTNVGFLSTLLLTREFKSCAHHINFAQNYCGALTPTGPNLLAIFTALLLLELHAAENALSLGSWRLTGTPAASLDREYLINGQTSSSKVALEFAGGQLKVRASEESTLVGEPTFKSLDDNSLQIEFNLGGEHHQLHATTTNSGIWVNNGLGIHQIVPVLPRLKHHHSDQVAGPLELRSQLPGKIVAIKVTKDEHIQAGTIVAVLESMKMEHPIIAPHAGSVEQVCVKSQDIVEAGTVLVKMKYVD